MDRFVLLSEIATLNRYLHLRCWNRNSRRLRFAFSEVFAMIWTARLSQLTRSLDSASTVNEQELIRVIREELCGFFHPASVHTLTREDCGDRGRTDTINVFRRQSRSCGGPLLLITDHLTKASESAELIWSTLMTNDVV